MDQQTYDTIQLGKEIESFLGKRIGEFVQKKAQADRNRAMYALGEADPTNSTQIAKIQADYNTPNKVFMWLSEAITEGRARLSEEQAREDNKE